MLMLPPPHCPKSNQNFRDITRNVRDTTVHEIFRIVCHKISPATSRVISDYLWDSAPEENHPEIKVGDGGTSFTILPWFSLLSISGQAAHCITALLDTVHWQKYPSNIAKVFTHLFIWSGYTSIHNSPTGHCTLSKIPLILRLHGFTTLC